MKAWTPLTPVTFSDAAIWIVMGSGRLVTLRSLVDVPEQLERKLMVVVLEALPLVLLLPPPQGYLSVAHPTPWTTSWPHDEELMTEAGRWMVLLDPARWIVFPPARLQRLSVEMFRSAWHEWMTR